VRALLGIVHQTILGAIRSKLFVSELILILVVSVAGPLVLEGDGTLNGQIALTVRYILSANSILLGLGILWASGSEMAGDLHARRLHLVRTKPIGGIQILTGKWLGHLILHSVLVLLSVSIAATMVSRVSQTYPPSPDAATALLAHAITRPAPAGTLADVEREFAAMCASGRLPADTDFQQIAPAIRSSLLAHRATVSTGQQRAWHVDSNAIRAALSRSKGNDAWLRFRFTSSAFERVPIQGRWELRHNEGSALIMPVAGIQDGEHVVHLSLAALSELMESAGADVPTTTIQFINGSSTESCTIMFDTRDPVELLIPRTTLAFNMLRASAIMTATLGALAALGLLCGVLFSGPVAAVVGLGTLAAMCLAMGTTGTHWADNFDDSEPLLQQTAILTDKAAAAISRAAEPAIRHKTISRLTSGEWLSPTSISQACLPLIGFYTLPLLLLGGAVLNRKQLGGA
jgi:hypothetical protein